MLSRRLVLASGLALAAAPLAAQPSARRIVALGSDVAETLFAIGAGAMVVATDDTATYPAAAASLPKLGYLRSLAPEPILAARPDLIIAADGAGPDAVLRQIESAGVRILRLKPGYDAADVAARIRTIGAAVGRAAPAGALATDLLKRLAMPLPQGWSAPACLLVLAQRQAASSPPGRTAPVTASSASSAVATSSAPTATSLCPPKPPSPARQRSSCCPRMSSASLADSPASRPTRSLPAHPPAAPAVSR